MPQTHLRPQRFAILMSLVMTACFCASAQGHFTELDPWVNNQRPAPPPVQPPPPAPTPSPEPDPTPDPAPADTPTPEQQHHVDALATNDLGCQAYNNGDWATAAKFFAAALAAEPNNPIFKDNLTNARNGEGCDAYAKGNWGAAADDFQQALQIEPDNQNCRNNLANAFDSQALAARNNGDYAAAINLFQKALASNPDNAAAIQSQLADVRQRQQNEQQDQLAAASMHQAIQNYVQGLAPAAATSTLQPVDPPIVDARDVPSGLGKAIDNAIAGAYGDAPPGVSDQVRKGFHAVATHDWPTAKAWFGQALIADPNNAGLKSLVALAGYTADRNQEAAKLAYVQLSEFTQPSAPGSILPDSDPMVQMCQNQMLEKQLDDFMSRYAPQHPEIALSILTPSPGPAPDAQPATALPSAWQRLLNFIAPHEPPHSGGSSGEIHN